MILDKLEYERSPKIGVDSSSKFLGNPGIMVFSDGGYGAYFGGLGTVK